MGDSALAPLPVRAIDPGPRRPAPFMELGGATRDDGPASAMPKQDPAAERMRQLEEMLREAQGRAEIIEKEAYDKAWQAGEKAGLELGRERGRQILSQMESLLAEAERAMGQMQARFSEAVLDVAEAVARRVVGELLDESPERLARMVAQAARKLPETGELSMAVAPEDAAMFERLMEEELAGARIVADERVRAGTCRIMARDHDVLVDADEAIAACMQAIREPLLAPAPPEDESGAE